MTIQRIPTAFPVPFSKVVKAGGFLFLSGVLPMDARAAIVAGDIRQQTRVVLENVRAALAESDASLADVVRVTVWLADLDDFAAFNEEYRLHFADALPARSTVRADLYQSALVEVEVQAWVGGDRGGA